MPKEDGFAKEHEAATLLGWLGLQPTKNAENDRNFFGFGDREITGLAHENNRPWGLKSGAEDAISRRCGEEGGVFKGLSFRLRF